MKTFESLSTPRRRTIEIAGVEGQRTGQTAQRIGELAQVFWGGLDTRLHMLTPEDGLDVKQRLARSITEQFFTKIVFWNPGEYAAETITTFRRDSVAGMAPRKDIFLVGFSETSGASGEEQYARGLELVKQGSANLVLATDAESQRHMVVAPEESTYDESSDYETALRGLMEMAYLRSQLTFTKSTVIDGSPVDWNSELVYPNLREVVNYCIEAGAYKPFLGVTAGHFAAKIGQNEFLTSRRKTNFNNLNSTGLVRVVTDGEDRVVAMGGKPSVGGQSQRIVFSEHPEVDSIVHFHCPLKPGSKVPVVSQREYECGSHQCGQNTSNGLQTLGPDGIEAVMLDNHGPNIVFSHELDASKVVDFIDANFDLTKKTGGYQIPAEAA